MGSLTVEQEDILSERKKITIKKIGEYKHNDNWRIFGKSREALTLRSLHWQISLRRMEPFELKKAR